MKLNEIYSKNWKVSQNLQINHNRLSHLQKEEQECHINILAKGESQEAEEAHICCSTQKWITKLSHNPSFHLLAVLVSTNEERKDEVLQLDGVIYDSALISIKSIRKKMNLTKEEREIRAKRMREAIHRKV